MTTKLTWEASVRPAPVRFDDIPSPCVGTCRLFPAVGGPMCWGCYRYATEIAKWPHMSAAEKRECVGKIASRQAAADSVRET